MQAIYHTLEDLFEQLGLKSDHHSIEHFVQTHQTLTERTPLYKASFWSAAQSTFLEESISEDADWAVVVDSLDGLLRS
jgi:hypothetical protein